MVSSGSLTVKEGTTLDDLKALFYEIVEAPELEQPELPLKVETIFEPFEDEYAEFKLVGTHLEYDLGGEFGYDDWDTFKQFLGLIAERLAASGWTHYERSESDGLSEVTEEYFGPDEAARHQAEVDSAWAELNHAQITYDRALAQQQGASNGSL